jgi:2-iminobutanoate/2-iminopropanoate deaminase
MLDGGVMTVRAEVHTSAAPAAIGPYSQGVRASGFVFTSGQIGADPSDGAMVEGVAAQADRALRNLAAVLSEAGSSLERVVKTTIFLTDMNDFAAVNEVYSRHLSAPFPARSTIAVKALPKGALVEIEMVALLPDEEPTRS